MKENKKIIKKVLLSILVAIIVCIASFVVYEAATVHNKYYKDEKNLQITPVWKKKRELYFNLLPVLSWH